MYGIHNTSTTSGSVLRLLSKPNRWFRRLRIIVNGSVVEDIDNYNRVCNMLDVFQTSNKRINDNVEGFGNSSTPFNVDNIDEPDSLADGKIAIVGFPCAHVYFIRTNSFH